MLSQKRLEAIQNQGKVASWIIDGMDQSKTSVPWHGTQHTFDPSLQLHLQCILEHGSGLTLYAHFDHTSSTRDVVIYCILAHLEKYVRKHKHFMEVLYLQLDGGPQNAMLMS